VADRTHYSYPLTDGQGYAAFCCYFDDHAALTPHLVLVTCRDCLALLIDRGVRAREQLFRLRRQDAVSNR